MGKQFDITAIGDCLIDMLIKSDAQSEKVVIEGNPGGAPANVLACAAKYGAKTGLITQVGQDALGDFLVQTLKRHDVDTCAMLQTSLYPTTLAFVHLDAQGDRSFSFYRNQSADIMLDKSKINYELINNTRLFHFGTVSMTAEPARTATLTAVQYARDMEKQASGKRPVISFDPNLRMPLWTSEEEARHWILESLPLADLVKLSEEELFFISDANALEDAIEEIYTKYPVKVLIVTLGPKGCLCRYDDLLLHSKAYDVKTVDTTGAGDAFWGTLLFNILKEDNLDSIPAENMKQILRKANAAGSLVTSKYGAITSMPTEDEVLSCIKTGNFLE